MFEGLKKRKIKYSLKISKRARQMRLEIRNNGSVNVVVPQGINYGLVDRFIAEKSKWIIDKLDYFKSISEKETLFRQGFGRARYLQYKEKARILAEKLNHKGISLDSGKLIPFNVLKNSEHDNSAYGLVFDLNDQFEEDSVRDLAEFKWDYARNEGISYAYLNGGRYWNYCYRDLDNSNGDARVVVVSGEATSKN